MRSTTLLTLATCTTSVFGHCLFQRVSINGADQGSLVGVRTPAVNNPVLNVATDAISCNTGLFTPVSTKVLTVPAGSKVGAWFQHVIGGPQYNPDPDNPIASSHKGPISVYLAPVSDASTAAGTGQKWFKIAEEGLDTTTGKWAVDSMIAGNGWWNFTMPSCIAAGQYLMRVELIALHSAYSTNGAQFYLSCANIQVTNPSTATVTPSSTVLFPGAYNSSDPGILINIYNNAKPSLPNNDLKPYAIPGPAPIVC